MTVLSNGAITANSLTASNNSGQGAWLQNNTGTGGMTLTGTNLFNTNGVNGLNLISNGTITANDITASANIGNGAELYNYTGTGDITLTGTKSFIGNLVNGLYVFSKGSIFANNITASHNTYNGAYMDNTYGAGSVHLTGTNIFSNNGATNGSNGLTVLSNGAITANSLTASNNSGQGAWLQNNTGMGGINLTGTNAFSGNGIIGLLLASNNTITANNITANNNNSLGVFICAQTATINNITSQYDVTGLTFIGPTNNLSITSNANSISNNTYGLTVSDANTLPNLSDPTIVSNNSYDFAVTSAGCGNDTSGSPINLFPVIIIQTGSSGTFKLNCARQGVYEVHLPNDDKVWIYCPVSGEAHIARLDNAFLPKNLPEGYTYASAFSLDIYQQNGPIPLITEGGHIRADFVSTTLQPGRTYSILYWDGWALENGTWVEQPEIGKWVPLKDFLLDENGRPQIFDLNPGDASDDGRRIISGVNVVNQNGTLRVEVSTNFPGVFVLAER